MAKNKKQKKRKKTGRIRRFFADERVKLSFGIFFILLALYTTLALISYLFTWRTDQSFEYSQILSDPDIQVENWAGKTGAYMGILLINKWFGIASFTFPVLLLIMGLHTLNIRLGSLWKAIRTGIIGMILVSATLGYLSGEQATFLGSGPGGGHGYMISLWLNSILGKVGAGLFLLFLDFAFILFSYRPSIHWFKKEKQSEDISSFDVSGLHEEEEMEPDEGSVKKHVPETETRKGTASDKNGTKDPHLEFSTRTIGEPSNNGIEMTIEERREDDHLDDDTITLDQENYDPTLDLPGYQRPTVDLLEEYQDENAQVSKEELLNNKNRIVETLANYNIQIDKIKATIGPTITLYEIVPAPGVRIAKIRNLEDDIALSLSALGIRIIAPIPGRGTIGIEVPNLKPEMVSMRSMIMSKKFQENNFELPIALGKTISNEAYVFDLTKMPHLLVAGATGQGKSVGLNVIIASLLYRKHPAELKFIFIDPKKVELTLYTKIERHFLAKLPDVEEPIITDTQKVINTLNSLTIEMDRRYDLMKKAHVRNIREYNTKFINRRLSPEKGHRYLPYIVMVIDEFADLIMTAGREIEAPLARIAQIARAIGIHLVIATQRPTTNIITGVIKANFPARVAFRVTSMIDSRTILDSPGANQLVGRGDMLIGEGGDLTRIQCAYVDTAEIDKVTEFIGSQRGYPTAFLLPEFTGEGIPEGGEMDPQQRDAFFEEAARLVVIHQQGSTSLIQRKLSIGYNRAGRIIDQLESAGIVGPFEGSKARKVLFSDEYALEQYLNELDKGPENTES